MTVCYYVPLDSLKNSIGKEFVIHKLNALSFSFMERTGISNHYIYVSYERIQNKTIRILHYYDRELQQNIRSKEDYLCFEDEEYDYENEYQDIIKDFSSPCV